MKSRILGILVATIIAVAWVAGSAWCQDQGQPATTSTAEQPAAAQPAAAAPAAQPAPSPAPMPAAESPAAKPAEQPAAQSAEKPQTAPAEQSGLQIQDAVVCQDVVNREPVGKSDVFAKDVARIYCFSRVIGASQQTQITHNWYYKGTLKASVKLPVRSDNWRTWSSKSIDPTWTGEWMVEILSDQGTPLESIIFYVQ